MLLACCLVRISWVACVQRHSSTQDSRGETDSRSSHHAHREVVLSSLRFLLALYPIRQFETQTNHTIHWCGLVVCASN